MPGWSGLGGVWLLATAAAGGPPAIAVRGDSRCPTAPEVAAALAGLLPPGAMTGAAREVVELSGQHSTSVSVRLTNAQNQVLAEKRLPESLSCAERARAAAVIVAAWEARFAAPPPIDGPPVQPPPLAPAPPRPAAPGASLTRAAPPLVAPAAVEVEAGAAVLASLAGGGLAPGIALDLGLSRGNARRALGLTAVAVGTHQEAVGSARGTWRRYGAGVDLRGGARAGAFDLQARAGVLLTALAVTGDGLPQIAGATLFDPGALVGLRARLRAGALAPWLEATAVYWPRMHDLYVRGTSFTAPLPAFESWLCAGVSLGADH